MRQTELIKWVFALLLAGYAQFVSSAVYVIDSPQALSQLELSDNEPNEILIRVPDGEKRIVDSDTWRFRVSGSKSAPLIIRPQTPHAVAFTGRTSFLIEGDYTTVQGFDFVDATEGTYAGQWNNCIICIFGNFNRVTASRFIESGNRTNPQRRMLLIKADSSHNRIDHNYVSGSRTMSFAQEIVSDPNRPAGVANQFDHNIFRNIYSPAGVCGVNGREAIQIGSDIVTAGAVTKTVIERNVFHNVVSDAEIISSKSSFNVIRNNVFVADLAATQRCSGVYSALSIRNGESTEVSGNFFEGTSGGIAVLDDYQRVFNNLITNTRRFGIRLRSREVEKADAPNHTIIAHNTVYNSEDRGLRLGTSSKTDSLFEAPRNNSIFNNVFHSRNRPIQISAKPGLDLLAENTVDSNLFVSQGDNSNYQDIGTNALRPVDPQLRGQREKRYLEASSPVINQGTLRFELPDRDYYSRRRPSGSAPDVGAIEFSATGSGDLSLPKNVPPSRVIGDFEPPRFSMMQTELPANQPFLFDAAAGGSGGGTLIWDFGDGHVVETGELAISHTYARPGTYDVVLTASHGRFSDQVTVVGDGDNGKVTIRVDDTQVVENDGTASVTVALSTPATREISAVVHTRAGTAMGGVDYIGSTQTIRFGTGEMRKPFMFTLVDDSVSESTETMQVRIAEANGAEISKQIAAVQIIDDDDSDSGLPSLTLTGDTVSESAGVATARVSLSKALETDVTLTIFTQPGDATAGSDYYGATEIMIIPAGATVGSFNIQILDDSATELSENILIRIVSVEGAVAIKQDRTAIIITDND